MGGAEGKGGCFLGVVGVGVAQKFDRGSGIPSTCSKEAGADIVRDRATAARPILKLGADRSNHRPTR